MIEIWKDIEGYEDKYQISNLGNVMSLNYRNTKIPHLLQLALGHDGYYFVTLCKGNITKQYKVHRLVAEAFIPNPENKSQVNHKNEIKTNNSVANLEWATASENINHGTRNQRVANANKIKVKCIETGEIFNSVSEAASAVGGQAAGISYCIRGERKTHKGLHWVAASF